MGKRYLNHTFAVCAYKESPYLDECVESLINQTIHTNVEIYTSTPNEYIYDIAKKYQVPVYVKETASDIQDDWNYAYNHAKTDYVTVTHQDDVYHERYVEGFLHQIKKHRDFSIYFCDYRPINQESYVKKDLNCHIRRLLRLPMKYSFLNKSKWMKKGILSLGNSIVCPLVTYNKAKLGESIFTSEFHFNLDWDTFLKIAELDGRFLYQDTILGYYRVHDDATSKMFIDNHNREIEDTAMFCKLWPEKVARFIMKFYVLAYQTYQS